MTGTGSAKIAGGLLELGGSDAQTITFLGASGTLKLDNPGSFTGHIAGISGDGDVLDLTGFDNAATVSYSGNASGGTVTVSEGSTTVHLTVAGSNIGTFVSAGLDSAGTGLLIHDPPVDTVSDNAASQTYTVHPEPDNEFIHAGQCRRRRTERRAFKRFGVDHADAERLPRRAEYVRR